MWVGRQTVGCLSHLNDVCSGDPEAEPEVLAVTMGNQARPFFENGDTNYIVSTKLNQSRTGHIQITEFCNNLHTAYTLHYTPFALSYLRVL